MARKKSIEPLLWTLFSAGGVVAALAMPVLLLLFAVVLPLAGDAGPSYDHLRGLLRAWPVRAALFLLCALALCHAAHRFRFTLYDGLQIKHLNELIATLCYGGAAVGAVVAAVLLW
jgi:fumarate reductase subunit D